MELCRKPIAELIPAPYNPRKPLQPGSKRWQKLERSLTEFELVQPIVWNEVTGYVVSGHQRLAILQHRGDTTVEVAVVRLSPAREKALNIALNNREVGSDWDVERLEDLLHDLQGSSIDATLTGFDERQLRDLLFTPATPLPVSPAAPAATQRILLEVPDAHWSAVRRELDDLLQRYPVTLHFD